MNLRPVLALAFVCVAAAAVAQPADPDPNGIGIYFDESAVDGSWCADAAPGGTVTAYLCITRAVLQSGFVHWQARLEHGAGGLFTGFRIRGAGTNTSAAPEFFVDYDTPLPWSISTVVLEVDVLVQWEWTIALRVWPLGQAAFPLYGAAADPNPLYRNLGYSWGVDPSSGDPNWCASINDPNCLDGPSVPAEDMSWGGVKALYR